MLAVPCIKDVIIIGISAGIDMGISSPDLTGMIQPCHEKTDSCKQYP